MATETAKNEMDKLISESVSKSIPKVGDVISGNIVSVGKNEIIVDIPGLTTGIVRGWEIHDESGQMTNLSIGDEVQATVIEIENERGLIELSFRLAGHQKAWDHLTDLKKEQTVVEVRATEANKGGLIVELGNVLGFLPVSQLSPEHYPRVEGGNKTKIFDKLKEYVGTMFTVKVIDVDESEEKLIVSERAIDEEKQMQALEGYEVGDTLDVNIVGIVDFGLFVAIPPKGATNVDKDNTLEGLVHISEVSWQRVDNLKELFKVGDTIKTQIISINGNKVSLSIKQLTEDPWKKAAEHFTVDQVIKGTVIKVNDFGAFVEMEHNIHGLAHISELAMNPGEDPKSSVEIGKEYEFKIINMEPEAHRLGLSRKALNAPAKTETPEAAPSEDAKESAPTETSEAEPTAEV